MTAHVSPRQLLARANQLAGQRQIEQALTLIETIHQQHPDFADAWLTGAFLYFQTNQIDKARNAIASARSIEPNNQMFAFQEVMMLDTINRPAEALPIAKKLAHIPLPNDNMNEQLAHFLEINFAFDEAKIIYKHLSQSQPKHINWLVKLAMIEQNFGRLDEATKLAQQALDVDPNNADALLFISHLKKQTTDCNHILQLQKSLNIPGTTLSNQVKIYFALAKELEDCQNFEQSFSARAKGANLHRSSFQYDVSSDIAFMQQIQKDFDARFLTDYHYNPEKEQPIFIVGLPRTGTTLLDRVISNHSEVTAAGELKHFNRAILHALQQQNQGRKLSRTEMVTASKNLNFEQLGRVYLENARTSRGNTSRFTDKLPLNSYYVGQILKALPGAKIIIMQRHPISVCYAVYKQLFYGQVYPYSYRLDEIADYYIEHNKLLKHWQEIGGDSVKTVYYEDLVSDLENQAKSILEFLNLSWQPECLDFHKNRQPTATASASQVRQKLYSSSVELWRHYQPQLQPMIEKLQAAGCLSDPRFES